MKDLPQIPELLRRHSSWIAAGVWALMLGALLARWLAAEDTYYFWDLAMYPRMAAEFFVHLKADVWSALGQLFASLADDYSSLFALPSALGFALFDYSRATYILTNYFFYMIAVSLEIAYILRFLRGWSFATSWLLALVALALVPVLWMPLAQGFPDIGGMAFLGLAAVLFLADLKRPHYARWIGIGLALALAILLRRHFAYAVAAFCLTMILCVCVQAWLEQRKIWRQKKILAINIGRCALPPLICLALLYLTSAELLIRGIQGYYAALYTSYSSYAQDLLGMQFALVGPVVIFPALAGLLAGWWLSKDRARLALLFLGALLIFWLIIWFGFVHFAGQHYLMQILPIVLPVGLVLAFDALRRAEFRFAAHATYGLLGLLVLNTCIGFWFADIADTDQNNRWPFRGLFSAPMQPAVRDDKVQLQALVNYLHATSSQQDRIAILASSGVLNQDLLMAIDAQRARETKNVGYMLPIVMIPEVDRRDQMPYDVAAQANIFVVAMPVQYHLQPEGQKVLGALVGLIDPASPIGPYLKHDDVVFKLNDGVTVSIWRFATPPKPSVTGATLDYIRKYASDSGSQPQDWAVLRSAYTGRIYTIHSISLYNGYIGAGSVEVPTQLFFMPRLSPGSYRVSGQVQYETPCPGVALKLQQASMYKLPIKEEAIGTIPPKGGKFAQDFIVNEQEGIYAVLQMSGARSARPGGGPCGIVVDGLQVERLIDKISIDKK